MALAEGPRAAFKEGPELLRALAEDRRLATQRVLQSAPAAMHHTFKNELQLLAHLADHAPSGTAFSGYLRAIASAHTILTGAPDRPDAVQLLRCLADEVWRPLLRDRAVAVELPDTPVMLQPEVAGALALIAHEFVLNAALHAQAQHLVVGLKMTRGGCTLTVRDDGCGFRGPAFDPRQCGFGLQLTRRLSTQHFGGT